MRNRITPSEGLLIFERPNQLMLDAAPAATVLAATTAPALVTENTEPAPFTWASMKFPANPDGPLRPISVPLVLKVVGAEPELM